MAIPLEESYQYCRRIARRRAKNFYYSFLLLDSQRRASMCAIYAFMRYCDDLSDSPEAAGVGSASESLYRWRTDLDRALSGDTEGNPLWPAFRDTVERYKIPRRFFEEMIDGVSSDLEPRRIQTFDELYRYCYQVASVVGLTIIHIFGFSSVRALPLAEKCGVAFQLTNIIRDVREDAQLGRIYLPQEDLTRFSVPEEQLRTGREDDRFRELIRFEANRARQYYAESEPLASLIDPASRRSLWALREIYQRLLNRIAALNYSVLSSRINVPTRSKVGLLMRGVLRNRLRLLSLALCAFALSNCSWEDTTYTTVRGGPQTRTHALYDSPAVEAMAELALITEQEYERARWEKRPGSIERYAKKKQELVDGMGGEAGYDVAGQTRVKILTDARVAPYVRVEFESGPFKGQTGWLERGTFDDPRTGMP